MKKYEEASDHEGRKAELTSGGISQQIYEKKVPSLGEEPHSEKEGSSLPHLPTERDVKQPTITSFFMKKMVKQGTKMAEKEKKKSRLNEKKEKKR